MESTVRTTLKPLEKVVLFGKQVAVYREQDILHGCLQGSPEFRAWYTAERGKIRGRIYWIRNSPRLPRELRFPARQIYGSHQILGEDIHLIILAHLPCSLRHVSTVAHELGHAVLLGEGFPDIGVPAEIELRSGIGSALGAMLHDPLVNRGLKEYGLDVGIFYRKNLEVASEVQGIPTPSDPCVQTAWIFNYAGTILDGEITQIPGDDGIEQFRTSFSTSHPRIASEGERLLGMVRRMGYSDPVLLGEVYQYIIPRYHLEGIVRVRDHPVS